MLVRQGMRSNGKRRWGLDPNRFGWVQGAGLATLGYHWPIGGLLVAIFSILALFACVGQDGVETTATPVSVSAPSPAPVLSVTSSDLTSAPSVSESELYRRIAPSVVFIETPIVDGGVHRTHQDGKVIETDLDADYTITGSGVLVEGGYIITSYRLVWPYGAVRVVFPDGSEFEEVPVANSDPLSGLAVLGPIDAPAPPLALADGEAAAIGTDLFLSNSSESRGNEQLTAGGERI